MKIATVVARFTMTGGIERSAAESSFHLKQRGHEVTVFSSKIGSDLADRLPFRRIPTLDVSGSTSIFTFGVSSGAFIPRKEFDIIHSHGTESHIYDIITFQSCHKAGLAMQKRFPAAIPGRMNFGIADGLRLRAERRIFNDRRFKTLIAVSHGVKRELCAEYDVHERDVVVIPNGVNLQQFHPAESTSRLQARKYLGIPDGAFVLIFVANEFDRKGLSVLIDALSTLNRPEVLLLIAGGDFPEPYLRYAQKRGVESRMRFCRIMNDPALLYRAGDAFVLPTSYEAFSLAMLEAAASGLPLLVTKVNGAEELVQDRINGLFIERDGGDLAQKLLMLCEDDIMRAALGMEARKSAEAYSWPLITDRILNVYSTILAHS